MLAVVAADIHLAPDWTLSIQLGVFLSALAILHLFVFRPVLRIIDRRKKLTLDSRGEAERLNSRADEADAERSSSIAAAIDEANFECARRIAEKRREAEKIVADAHAEARRLLDSTEISVESSAASIAIDLDARAKNLATEIVARVLGVPRS